MKKNLLKAQLVALDAQLDALHGQVLAMMEAIDDGDDACRHEQKTDISTIDCPPSYRCDDCGAEWEEQE